MILVRGSPPLGEPPPGEKNQLLQFQPKHPQNLIPSALRICDPRIQVWKQSNEWLMRTNGFPEGEASPPPGEPPPGEKKSTSAISTQTLQKLNTICAYTTRIYHQSLGTNGPVVVEITQVDFPSHFCYRISLNKCNFLNEGFSVSFDSIFKMVPV
jgi:hypothetical protein